MSIKILKSLLYIGIHPISYTKLKYINYVYIFTWICNYIIYFLYNSFSILQFFKKLIFVLFYSLQPKSKSFRAKCAVTNRVEFIMAWLLVKAAKVSFAAPKVPEWSITSVQGRRIVWWIESTATAANHADYRSAWHSACLETVRKHCVSTY